MKTFRSYSEVLACIGQEVAVSDWITISQAQIQMFADATGDQQWIHTDPERAAKGPFGVPIAHGFLTLSLLPQFFESTFEIEGSKMGVNYGCDKVRFPAPVKVGARIRGRGEVVAAEPVKGDGVQITVRISVEIEGADKPGCVVDTISRLYFD